MLKRGIWVVLLLLIFCGTAFGAKEKLVLLPLQGKGLSAPEKKLYQNAIKSELSKKYKIYSGDEVEAKLKKFAVTSCTSDECLEQIAIAFNGHLVGRGNVTLDSSGTPLLGLEIKDIITNEDVFSESAGCEGCNGSGIIRMFKTMAAGRSTAGPGAVAYVSQTVSAGPASGSIVRVTPKVTGNTGSKVAALFFDSKPSGATVYLGDTVTGTTPYQNFSLKPGQTIQVMLQKGGYHDKRVELTLSGGTNELGTLVMTSLYGTLKVDSIPDGADVYVAGKKVGVTPYANDRMRAGAYLISIRKELYKPVENRQVVVKEEKTTREKISLKANFGTLKITSTPSGADVIIAGKKVGTTPFIEKRMYSGAYLVSLRKELYLPVENRRVVIKNEEKTQESFKLTANYGTLAVGSAPKGASFTMKNAKGESVQTGTTPATIQATPGAYTLALTKEGYAPLEFEVTLARDKTLAIDKAQASLRKLQGEVFISSEPYIKGAKVWVDGREAGLLPLSLLLGAGLHEIQVKTDDKAGKSKVTVNDGGAAVVKVHLKDAKVKPFTNSIGMTFVWIEPGTFMMGSPSSEPDRNDDETQHRVTLTKGFFMQTTEVTVGQWRRFIHETGYRTEAETDGGAIVWTGSKWEKKSNAYWANPGFSQSDECPVTCVSWNDAQRFIGWLNRKGEGHYQLPTEAQWEYACRAGSHSPYANSRSLSDMGWYGDNSGRKTHSVAKKDPNSWGLYDMHGNVYEWCQDWDGDYPSEAVTDPMVSSSSDRRVLRGGSWNSNARYCSSANRHSCMRGYRCSNFGFRLLRGPE